MIDKKFLKPHAEIINFVDNEIIVTSGPDGQVDEVDINGIPIEN